MSKNVSACDIHSQIVEVYDEEAINIQHVAKWCTLFNQKDSVGGKVRSGYLLFRTNASTLPIMPKRSSWHDVGTSSYRYHTATTACQKAQYGRERPAKFFKA
ncbi:hypothetical protein TNCV_3434671 [Trichonephila clavipes]|nr:hypothetical protein TNCV_3434671 [Trichonephila clavipes]